MQDLIEKFNSYQKCESFRKSLAYKGYELDWAQSGGVVIRRSLEDNIGTTEIYATIQLCDWYGYDEEEREHRYSFVVFLYDHEIEDRFYICDTIEEAIQKYKKTLQTVQRYLSYEEVC